jgi:ankyrin repeat protein/DNA replication protein DnaC
MGKLCVPYRDTKLEDPKYQLYSIDIDESHCPSWNFRVSESNDVISKKLKGLQKYFNSRNFEKQRKEFELRTLFPLNNVNKYVEVLDEETTSVFLGIFLKAAEQIQGRKFKEDWDIVCATGDLEYDENDRTLRLLSVKDHKKKYKDEFEKTADAETHKRKKYLFLYIGDEDKEKILPTGEGQGKHGNITIKRFSPKDTLEELLYELFKTYPSNYDFDGIEPEQKKFLDKMKNRYEKENSIGYIQGEGFSIIESKILDTKWHGFYIHGKEGSGKSALAMEIAHKLVWERKIYCYIWIKINSDEIKKIEKEGLIKSLDEKEKRRYKKIEEYITLCIKDQIGQDINTLKKELLNKKILVIVDNLELNENDVTDTLLAVQEIFSNENLHPYLVITNWNPDDDPSYIIDFNLQEITVPRLRKVDVILLITVVAENFITIKEKISRGKNNGSFADLEEIISQKYNNSPHLIISSILLLLKDDIEVADLYDIIRKESYKHEDTIRDEEIKIYESTFSSLDILQKQVLYLFLEFGKDILITVGEIYKKINEFEQWKGNKPTWEELTEILNVLSECKLLNSIPINEYNNLYEIKSIPYHIFIFEEKFLHSSQGTKDFMRDKFIDLPLQLEKALEYDLDIDIVKPILKRMKEKEIAVTNNFMFLAVLNSSKPKILSLLKKFGCNINIHDKIYDLYLTPFALAIAKNTEIKILDWFIFNGVSLESVQLIEKGVVVLLMHIVAAHNPNPKVIEWLLRHNQKIDEKDNNGCTVFHFAAYNNPAVLAWLFEHVPELRNCKNDNGFTVFHYAAAIGNSATLAWLLKYALELLNYTDNYGCNAIHYAARNSNTAILKQMVNKVPELLDSIDDNGRTVLYYAIVNNNHDVFRWLLGNVAKLFYCTDNDGCTIFHHAAEYSDTSILDELFKNVPKLLKITDNNGRTVFHCAAKSNSPEILEWLYKHASELLYDLDNHGLTVFHSATANRNITVLGWLFDHVPKLLDRATNEGHTVFDVAIVNGNVAVLDWLFEHVPELLDHADNEGFTVFHLAIVNGNVAVLDWLFEHVPELLDRANNKGYTVFHGATVESNITVLEWLFKHVPELLDRRNNDGRTVFHVAVTVSDITLLDWLYGHALELLGCTDNDGQIVFHYAAAKGLLGCTDNDGQTVFHYAAAKGNSAILDWLFEHAPKGLLGCKRNDGCTVFHIAFLYSKNAENSNIDVLDWLSEHAPLELLNCATDNGITVFDIVEEYNDPALLGWLSEHSSECNEVL